MWCKSTSKGTPMIKFLIPLPILFVSFILSSCDTKPVTHSVNDSNASDQTELPIASKVVATFAELPPCDVTLYNHFFYVLETNEFQTCTQSGYVLNSIKGTQGALGDTGIQGATGTQGLQGEAGEAGIQGAAGQNGSNGTNGTDGVAGANGSSCTVTSQTGNAILNCDDSTTVTLEPGTQGATGPQGNSFLMGVGAPLPANGAIGDTYLEITHDVFYQKSNSGTWELLYYDTASFMLDPRDSTLYTIQKIGGQIWLGENLHFQSTNSRCYDDNSSHCNTYGRLYDWSTAMDACPTQWHLPSSAEWQILNDYVSEFNSTITVAEALKSKSHWVDATDILESDTHSFSALPAGRLYGTEFLNVGIKSYWWSSNDGTDPTDAVTHHLYNDNNTFDFEDHPKDYLVSVRCVKDQL